MNQNKIAILLLEDEAAHAEAIRRSLESANTNYEIQVVDSLKKYRQSLKQKLPDIALLDMLLPDGNAMELLTSQPEADTFPKVFFSSQADEQLALKTIEAGAQDFIVKSPSTFADLPQILDRNMTRWQLITKNRQVEADRANQNSRLLSIINSTEDILIFSLDRYYGYTVFNEAHRKMMSKIWLADIQIGMNFLECMTNPEPRKIARESINRVFAGEHFQEIQYQADQNIWFEFNWNSIRDQNGAVIGVTSFIRDITERKQAEAKIIELEALKLANQAKSELLANVSHELRTPLASIKGNIETLIEPDVKWSKAQMMGFLHAANIEADRLTLLIRDLLDMSRIDAGKLKLDKGSYRINEILESASSVLSVITAKHKLKIAPLPDLPAVQVDKVRIVQVITNLVENATKFSPEGSQIEIKTVFKDNQVIISVEDRGVGMPPEVVGNLFNRFYQAAQVVNGKTRGTGLGLTICKGIVEGHGGEIRVESQEGKGSKFSFSLPVGGIGPI